MAGGGRYPARPLGLRENEPRVGHTPLSRKIHNIGVLRRTLAPELRSLTFTTVGSEKRAEISTHDGIVGRGSASSRLSAELTALEDVIRQKQESKR